MDDIKWENTEASRIWQTYDNLEAAGWSRVRELSLPEPCTKAEYEAFLAMKDTPDDLVLRHRLDIERRQVLLDLGVCLWSGSRIYRKGDLWILNYYSAEPSPLFAPDAKVEILESKMILAPYYRCFMVLRKSEG